MREDLPLSKIDKLGNCSNKARIFIELIDSAEKMIANIDKVEIGSNSFSCREIRCGILSQKNKDDLIKIIEDVKNNLEIDLKKLMDSVTINENY